PPERGGSASAASRVGVKGKKDDPTPALRADPPLSGEGEQAAGRGETGGKKTAKIHAQLAGPERLMFSEKFACPVSGFTISEIEPRLFSFNNPFGACPKCG